MSKSETCSFCSPSEMNWRLIHEDELTVSFLSDPRLTLGHTLVIPRRHTEPPEKLTESEIVALFQELERLRSTILGHLAVGVDIFQKTRTQVPQGHNGTKVNHLHFHVLPSNPDSELYEEGLVWTAERFSSLSSTEAKEVIPILQKGSSE